MQPEAGSGSGKVPGKAQRVSVVVVTVDRLEEMRRFLPSLAAQTRVPNELVVVDAAPSDALESELRIHSEQTGVPLKYLTSERGICHQRNRAVEACTGDFIFFFDDDVELEADYIEHAMAAFSVQAARPVGGVGGTLLDPLVHPSWKRWIFHLLSLSHVGRGVKAVGYPNGDMRRVEDLTEATVVPLLEGCRMAFRREVFEGECFQQYLPGYCRGEDGDFSARVAAQWTLVQTPRALLRHHVSETGRLVGEAIVYQRAFSRSRFFRRYSAGVPSAWLRFSGGMFGWGTLLVVRSLLSLNPRLLRGLVRGIGSGWRAGSTLQ
jgi:GT2 family glycosyltransferase